MQKVLYFNNLFYINDLYMYMCLSRDKLGTKFGVKNAKRTSIDIEIGSFRSCLIQLIFVKLKISDIT